MPSPVVLQDDDTGVDILIRKKVKQGKRVEEKKTYIHALPQSPAEPANPPAASHQVIAPGEIMMEIPSIDVQPDIDYTIPDIPHVKATMVMSKKKWNLCRN